MKNRYHKNKFIRKKLKDKKSSNSTKNRILAKAKSPLSKKTFGNKFNKGHSKWKLPSLLVLSGLLMIILVIPTLVVLPFNSNESVASTTIEQEFDSSEGLDDDSAISVAVMRTQTDSIENVPLETYVARVVASEMPAKFEMEALKSQALAARTYIVNQLLYADGDEESDVTDTIMDQVYKGEEELRDRWGANYNQNMKKITDAVAATKGEILTFKDAPISPAYFSTSNGYTENSEDYWANEIPYLRSVASPWDVESPYYLDQETFTLAEVEEALEVDLPDNASISIQASRTESNRINQVSLGEHTFTGREVRDALELRSSDFTIEQKNNHLIFTTKGNGHGIGMSQYGANGMAKEGKSYEEILKYYYQDVEIGSVDEVSRTLVAQ
ncbi:stage II sporulation protein D [Ornithinibacillus halophilus]|uniref:Stage II sporulation protein D n=1 Tax=Ornithinibacillus halophilus TaxID=930117 RepID=A0A1M5N5X1_9BACI|nr:stage II sporulation protein D [Ornithinibacillus halophilus]SHG84911.1 stage II sporulation protein D [Ornithinibacillus halophilus]